MGDWCGKHEEKRTLGTCKRRWEGEFKMGLEKWDRGMYWIYLAPNRDKWWAISLK